MTPAVTAGSLSTVINLADNPPSNPRDKAVIEVQQPLVLYIARVPGSKGEYLWTLILGLYDKTLTERLDIFLTTMKPLQKVVTAQDIESSLYYVHVDGAEDDKIREILLREQEHRICNGEADGNNTLHGGINGVATKPLPGSPQLDLGDRPTPPPKVYPYYQPPANGARGGTQHARQSAGYDIPPKAENREIQSIRPSQNLLGPRAMHQRLRSADSAVLNAVPERQNINLRRWSEQPTITGPPLPPRPYIRRKEVSSNQSPKSSGEYASALPPRPNISRKELLQSQYSRYSEATLDVPKTIASDQNCIEEENISLTLIRRYGGLQWNVGKISNKIDSMKGSDHIPGPHTNQSNEHSNGAVSIEISTPGYSRFEDSSPQTDQSRTTNNPQDSPNHETFISEDGVEARAVFRRQLQAYRDEIRPDLRHTPGSTASVLSAQDPRPTFNFRKLSHHSESQTLSPPPSQRSKPPKTKHYTFRSPWNGTCDFDVGVLGHSIKCKHSLQISRTEYRSAQVSELRFNLPSSKAFGSSPAKGTQSPNGGTPRESKRSSIFSPHHHQRHQSSLESQNSNFQYCHDDDNFYRDADGDTGRMDLSLGQERAGGGFGGKQAKLGKLIVDGEGLKMLDLVVAANVGLWWKVYGRVV